MSIPEAWARYLSCIDKNAPWKELEAVDSEVKDTRSMIEKVFGSNEKYLAYLQEEKAQMAFKNQLYTARKEGYEEGFKIGFKEGLEEVRSKKGQTCKTTIAEMVVEMIAEGLSLEVIANITKLSREEIEEAATAATEATTEETP